MNINYLKSEKFMYAVKGRNFSITHRALYDRREMGIILLLFFSELFLRKNIVNKKEFYLVQATFIIFNKNLLTDKLKNETVFKNKSKVIHFLKSNKILLFLQFLLKKKKHNSSAWFL